MSRGRIRHVLVHAADVPRLRGLTGPPLVLHHQFDALHPGALAYSTDLIKLSSHLDISGSNTDVDEPGVAEHLP